MRKLLCIWTWACSCFVLQAQSVFPPSATAGAGLTPATFASPPAHQSGKVYLFTDASTTGVCSAGSDGTYAVCYDNGTTFVATSSATGTGLGDPGSNSVPFRNGSGTSIPATATQLSAPHFCSDVGSTDSYACTVAPAIASYATGTLYWFTANTANTGACSINLNGIGAKAIKKTVGGITTDLNDNDIVHGMTVGVFYDGTNMQMAVPVANRTNAPLASADIPNNAANTSGTAGNLSGTPALPNGTTATTQSQADGSTKIATTAYADTLGATKVPTSTTVNGHALTGPVTVTASDAGLGNVTNDAQTKASIVPNTVPTPGQFLAGNAGGTAYAPVSMSGSCTMTSAGVTTCSGGGSIFTGSTASTSSFSATPTFSLADVSVKSPARFEPAALTANVTSVTFTNKSAGAKFSIAWLQDGTGARTVAYGASASNTCVLSPTAGKTTTHFFEVAADGSTVVGVGCTSDETVDRIPLVAAPGTPASGLACWADSTDLTRECKDTAGVVYKMVKTGVDINPVTGQTTATHLASPLPKAQGGAGADMSSVTFPSSGSLVANNQANTYSAGTKQTQQASATTAGENVACAALPSTPATGDVACDSADANKLKWWNGSSWQTAGASVTGLGDPGSNGIVYRNGSGTSTPATAVELAAPLWVAGGGTAQAQTATYSPAITSLTDGLRVCWKPTAANTAAAPTFAPNGLTAHTVVKAGGALVANDIITTAQACAIYNTTSTQWELQNPQTVPSGSGNMITTGPNTMGSAGTIDASGQTGADSFKMPSIAGCAPTAVGSICRDSTQKTNVIYSETWAGVASLPKLVYSTFPVGDTLCTQNETSCTNSGTVTDLAFVTQPSFPATAWVANKRYHVKATLQATIGSTSITSTAKVKFGGTSCYVGAVGSATGTTPYTNNLYDIEFTVWPGTISSSGTLYCTAPFINNVVFPMPRNNNGTVPATGFNLTTSLAMSMTIQFSGVNSTEIAKLLRLEIWEEN